MFSMDSHPSSLMEKKGLDVFSCSKDLSNDSMKPTKLRQDLHPQNKDKNFLGRHGNAFKRMKLHSTGTFQEINQKITEASYSVILEIAKQKKQHTIGENLIKPCSLKMVEFVLENRSKKKDLQRFHYQTTIQQRISDMAIDIKEQVEQEIKSTAFGIFSIQLDESTAVAF